MFEGFASHRIATPEADIACVVGGSGPPVLLLHGFPQTHAMWHAVAPALAARFTVVAADLRGYGDSGKPMDAPGAGPHAAYAKRAMADDQLGLMRALGFERFHAIGHDRGGRVVHRMALDHPDRLLSAAVLDIVPTATVFAATSQALATAYFHWFFLIQSDGLPERMIRRDPDDFFGALLVRWSGGSSAFTTHALAAYRQAWRDPASIHAMCEDYRAAATIDIDHHKADREAGRRIACPLLVLWGTKGAMHRLFDVPETWRAEAGTVRAEPIEAGHFLAEEAPAATADALLRFLSEVS